MDHVTRTDDERWIVVDGRRWRASDPSIPEALRSELVTELMSARRSVGTARRGADPAAVTVARARVDDAKRALGERGRAWWEAPTGPSKRRRIKATVLALARHRAPGTICPSDVARVVGGDDWRSSMNDIREVAAELQAGGEVVVLQGGAEVDVETARGPVRIRLTD